MIDLLVHNPCRPVDAWWRRATGYLDGDQLQPTPTRDGGRGCRWIKQAMRFSGAAQRATTEEQRRNLIVDYPAIYRAHWLATRPENRVVSAGIEGRILARHNDQEIAKLNGCWPEVIEAYEALYFNVRDRLKFRDFIFCRVLGAAYDQDLDHCEYDLLWKLFGYVGGPHVLEALMARMPAGSWVNRPESVATFFQQAAIDGMKQHGAVAAFSMPVGRHTQLKWIDAFVKFIELERTTDAVGADKPDIHEGLQLMLDDFPYISRQRDEHSVTGGV